MEETDNKDHQVLIDEAIYLRGRLISSYAQAEFLFADFVEKLENRFSYLVDARVKRIKKIAETVEYEAYRDDLFRVCDQFSEYDEMRHFMAHGFMRMDVDGAGNHRFELLRYVRQGDGKYQMLSAKTDIYKLRDAAKDMGEYVTDVLNLFQRIYREKKLEPS